MNIAQHIGLGDKISTMPKTKETSLGSAIEDSDGIAEIYPEDKYTREMIRPLPDQDGYGLRTVQNWFLLGF